MDTIIANCVINLSIDKDRVIEDAFRVLKPGGRFAVSDVAVKGRDVPADVLHLRPRRIVRCRGEMPGSVFCVFSPMIESRLFSHAVHIMSALPRACPVFLTRT